MDVVFDDNSISNIAKAFFDDGVANGKRITDPKTAPKSSVVKSSKVKGSDTYRIPMKRELYGAIRSQYVAIDGFLALFSAKANNSSEPVDCKKGCEWCCHQTVYALNYEIEYLFKWLKFALTPDQIEALAIRVKAKRDALKDLKGDARSNFKMECSLLEDGSCMAYEGRPMACRIYLSSSEKSCRDEYDNKGVGEAKLFNLPLRCGQLLNEGFTAVLNHKSNEVKEMPIEMGLYEYLKDYL